MTLPTLDATARKALEYLATWTRDAQQLRRAQALLWLDEGESVAEIADRLRLSRQEISTWITHFHARPGLDSTARVAPGVRSGRPRTLQGRLEPLIAAVITRAPRVAGYGHRGEPVEVPVTGQHARRVLHGVLKIQSGGVLFLSTATWDPQTHQAFLAMLRQHWSGWPIILFEDRGSPHTAATSQQRATALGIAVRYLPAATPELHAMDHLWRYVNDRLLANRATQTIDASADAACQALLAMRPHERLRKAGALSGHCWLHQ